MSPTGALPVRPPVSPVLARLERELPVGDGWSYEPKWDGFRCLVFRDGDDVDLRSRNDRPLARYFPEVVAAALQVPSTAFVVDGELIVRAGGAADFSALLARLHPAASLVAQLAVRTPATFVAFDVLAVETEDLRSLPHAERRDRLGRLLADSGLATSPITAAAETAAAWLDAPAGSGIDGVVAKHATTTYDEGRRVLVKVKREHTVDCVVAGFRVYDARPDEVSSLLLGLHGDDGSLHHVGIAGGLPRRHRRELLDVLRPLLTGLSGHPWERGFGLEGGVLGRLKGTAGRWTPDLPRTWNPVRPELVCEVAYDHLEGLRFRHPARLRRWRPDRDPRSCTVEQIA